MHVYTHIHAYMYIHMYLHIYIYMLIPAPMIHIRAFFWFGSREEGCIKSPQCSKNPEVLGHEAKHCNARKIPKILKFRDLWPSSLHSLQKFRILGSFRALQCLAHLMPQNCRIFRALQCLVYLRATKHCNARKILKFWGMRCTKHCNARKIPKILKFRHLWPSSLHSLQKFRILGSFRALQCLVHLMP